MCTEQLNGRYTHAHGQGHICSVHSRIDEMIKIVGDGNLKQFVTSATFHIGFRNIAILGFQV
jgi:hypothetical protein